MPPRLSKEQTVRLVYSMPASHMRWLKAQGEKTGNSAAGVLRALVEKARKGA